MSTNDKLRKALEIYAKREEQEGFFNSIAHEALSASKPEPRLQWCDQCGEGVTDFCRGKGGKCAYGFSKPEPQAQAGEPEIIRWQCRHRFSPSWVDIDNEQYKWFTANPQLVVELRGLITQQAHREAMNECQKTLDHWLAAFDEKSEAIAKKDAALDACVEALGTCRIVAKDDNGNYTREVTPKIITDAITQAQEARKS